MIEGKKVMIAGTEWVVPPVNLAALKKHSRLFEAAGNGQLSMSTENIEAMSDLVFMVLKRNYPDIAQEQVDEMLDLGNLMRVFAAVAGAAGFETSGEGPQ